MKALAKELKNSLDSFKEIDPKFRMLKIKNIEDHTGYYIAEELRLNDGRYFTAVYELSFEKGEYVTLEGGEPKYHDTAEISEVAIVDLYLEVSSEKLDRVSEIPENIYDEMCLKIEIWHEENGEFPEPDEI